MKKSFTRRRTKQEQELDKNKNYTRTRAIQEQELDKNNNQR